MNAAGISQLSVLGLVATQAAYEHGDEWYEKMMAYVKSNIDYARNYVEVISAGGKDDQWRRRLYLVWLDFRGTGIETEELDRRIIYDREAVVGQRKNLRKNRRGIPADQCGCTEKNDNRVF